MIMKCINCQTGCNQSDNVNHPFFPGVSVQLLLYWLKKPLGQNVRQICYGMLMNTYTYTR